MLVLVRRLHRVERGNGGGALCDIDRAGGLCDIGSKERNATTTQRKATGKGRKAERGSGGKRINERGRGLD